MIGSNGLADLTLSAAIRRHTLFVLDYCGGDYQWAASELGIAESTLYRWRRSEWAMGFFKPRQHGARAADERQGHDPNPLVHPTPFRQVAGPLGPATAMDPPRGTTHCRGASSDDAPGTKPSHVRTLPAPGAPPPARGPAHVGCGAEG